MWVTCASAVAERSTDCRIRRALTGYLLEMIGRATSANSHNPTTPAIASSDVLERLALYVLDDGENFLNCVSH